jgi:hypothetical protein
MNEERGAVTESTEQPTEEIAAPKRRFHLTRRWSIALAALGGLLVVGLAGISYAAFDYGQKYEGRILPGTTVAGVAVGGLEYDEALAKVRAAVRPQLTRTIALSFEDRAWETTPAQLKARSDAKAAVQAALEASDKASFMKIARMRWLGDDLDFERSVGITYPRKGAHGFIEGLASSFNREARDAELDSSSGWVEIVKAKEGRTVNVDRSRIALMGALREGESLVPLTVKVEKPEVTEDEFEKVLLLRIGENKVYLYEKGKITHTYTVATGQPEYPTPTGTFEVAEKRYMPTWVNPDPEGWGASLPESIPPGPNSPLGLRALNWSAPLIRFHGTPATYSLGYNASHGCVRFSNTDIVELYDLVDVGTPIVSVQVAPLRPLYVAAPDPILVEEEAEGETDKPAEEDDKPADDGKSKKDH